MLAVYQVISLLAVVPAEKDATSHCREDETMFYHCVVENTGKVASVCGRGLGVAGQVQRVQYRFGLVGKVEFEFPLNGTEASKSFHFESQRTRDGSTQDYFLWFRSGKWIYEVYYREEFDDCSETGCSSKRTGQAAFVSVWRGAEAWRVGDESKGMRFRCTNPADSEMFKALEGSQLYNRENEARIF